ncbi:MAG: phosphoserine phosphatase SerB [Ponticaulis sp.]|nr:phosphoserine phosphatase SerB [Ponticaulis sp.]|tara:strand:- start:25818 stop:26726 length:909 start_codon:yes stop_codon:yes gene_type:complete
MTTEHTLTAEIASEPVFIVLVARDGETHLVPDYLKSASVKLLGPGATELYVDEMTTAADELKARLSADVGDRFDICVTGEASREKKLLICDMDSTVIGQECIDELADFAGVRDRISEITERAMRGELDFEAALTERVGLLKGLSGDALQTCFDERITLNPGVKTLTATMKARGATCLLVSGGFTFFTSRVAEAAGFTENYANTLLFDGEALSGEVGRPILGRQAKLDRLNAAVETLGISNKDVLSMGDGANDLSMIEAAGLGVGYKPHPILAKAAEAVIEGDSLATALYFQGIAKAEWVVED